MPQVFISYRQLDSVPQQQRVRAFAEQVRAGGIEVILDQFYLEENPGGPPRGWAHWCGDQATDAKRVIIIGDAAWFRSFEGEEIADTGLGAACEAAIIRARLYGSSGFNNFVRIAYFDKSDLKDIPLVLGGYQTFHVAGDLPAMVAWLGGSLRAGQACSQSDNIPGQLSVPQAQVDEKVEYEGPKDGIGSVNVSPPTQSKSVKEPKSPPPLPARSGPSTPPKKLELQKTPSSEPTRVSPTSFPAKAGESKGFPAVSLANISSLLLISLFLVLPFLVMSFAPANESKWSPEILRTTLITLVAAVLVLVQQLRKQWPFWVHLKYYELMFGLGCLLAAIPCFYYIITQPDQRLMLANLDWLYILMAVCAVGCCTLLFCFQKAIKAGRNKWVVPVAQLQCVVALSISGVLLSVKVKNHEYYMVSGVLQLDQQPQAGRMVEWSGAKVTIADRTDEEGRYLIAVPWTNTPLPGVPAMLKAIPFNTSTSILAAEISLPLPLKSDMNRDLVLSSTPIQK